MDDDVALVSQLGGFALDQFLGDFTGDKTIKTSGLASLGLGTASSARKGGNGVGNGVEASQIYSDRFVDDDNDNEQYPSRGGNGRPTLQRTLDPDDDDWEDEIDRELDEEDRLVGTSLAGPALLLGASSSGILSSRATTRLRGEDDDFDDDGDEYGHAPPDRGGYGLALPPQPMSNHIMASFNMPEVSEILHVDANANGQPHASAEQDYVDAQELAEQQSLFQQSYARMQQRGNDNISAFLTDSVPMLDVNSLYPSFAPDRILNYTELFTPRPRKRARIDPSTALYPLPQPSEYTSAPSTRDFRSHQSRDRSSAVALALLESLRELIDDEAVEADKLDDFSYETLVETAKDAGWGLPHRLDDPLSTVNHGDWDDAILWDGTDSRSLVNGHGSEESSTRSLDARRVRFQFRNPEVESGEWTRGIIWSDRQPLQDITRLQLTLNDAYGPASVAEQQKPPELKRVIMRRAAGAENDPYNLSNDKLYEVRREQKKTVRQTFGHLEVQHSYPAMKLQLPWYKTQLSKNELRSFHRLPIQFPTNIPLSFSKVRSAKRKKDKTGRKLKKDSIGSETFRTMGDLSLRDTGGFVLWEYSEENPPIISNVGMGSILVNYYRKTDMADTYVPKSDLGEPFLLDPSDESPFLRFGQVEPGQMIPALYNKLVRAPLFRHRPYDTDFIVVKTTVDGETKFYVREIQNIFVVGQTYPRTEVPGPQARKLTATAKHRLQSITYKLISKNPKKRVKISKLLKYFPEQSEMQMRGRLKEFMEFNRAGDDQGFWKIKAGRMPDEDELFKLIGPEHIVLSESTQVGQRNLLDAGFSSTVDEDKGKDNEESTLDVRQQLAPWFTTKNFINATQNKAMLKLHGEGDPSHRGEGYSFLRVSMKDIFLRAGEKIEDRLAEIESRPKSAHRYNVAEQQTIYRTEIERIWRSQFDALSSPYEPIITEEDEVRFRQLELKMESGQTPGDFTSMSPAFDGALNGRSQSPAMIGQAKGQSRILRIRRLINGEWRSEIVRDAAVIKGYLRQRQNVDAEEEQEPEALVLTGDPEHDALVRKKLAEKLDKLRKNQERRLQRKNAKMGITGDVFLPGGKKVKHETTRKCGNCGAIGHMKTNRKCPKWAEFNAANNAEPGANAPSAVSNPFAVGLPGLSGMQASSPTA